MNIWRINRRGFVVIRVMYQRDFIGQSIGGDLAYGSLTARRFRSRAEVQRDDNNNNNKNSRTRGNGSSHPTATLYSPYMLRARFQLLLQPLEGTLPVTPQAEHLIGKKERGYGMTAKFECNLRLRKINLIKRSKFNTYNIFEELSLDFFILISI